MRLAPPPREGMYIWQSLSTHIRQERGDGMPLTRFLYELDLDPIVAESKPEEVRCLTIHQANGKVFPRVHLIGVAEDLIPSWRAKKLGENRRGVQEERRNCFVAITHASESVTLPYAWSYFGVREAPVSVSGRDGFAGAEPRHTCQKPWRKGTHKRWMTQDLPLVRNTVTRPFRGG